MGKGEPSHVPLIILQDNITGYVHMVEQWLCLQAFCQYGPLGTLQ